jgi:L-amino acid N-acyltransferase YncA
LIVALLARHWPQVRAIYQAGIDGGDATFETEPPSWEQWDREHLSRHRFVDVDGERVRGWTAVSPASRRAVYAGVVEVSVYVDPGARRRGVGRALLEAVIGSTESYGIWTLQAGIFPENAPSVALHESVGFRQVGIRERLGRHSGTWRDVVLLERRSVLS